jgi:hypothetical protein
MIRYTSPALFSWKHSASIASATASTLLLYSGYTKSTGTRRAVPGHRTSLSQPLLHRTCGHPSGSPSLDRRLGIGDIPGRECTGICWSGRRRQWTSHWGWRTTQICVRNRRDAMEKGAVAKTSEKQTSARVSARIWFWSGMLMLRYRREGHLSVRCSG